MKTTSGAYNTHIQGECTTLATIWRVTWRDKTKFFFTDHDRDIDVDVDGGTNEQKYKSSTGFTRSSIVNTSSLSVDNMDIETILDADSILEKDVRGGKWDFAEIEVYSVNWDDTSQGVMQLRRGFLGEFSINDELCAAELRGLVQLLSQTIGQVVTPNCRADHGDTKCGFDLSLTTETTEVTAIDATNRLITVPDHFIGKTSFPNKSDFLLNIGTKVDESDDPAIGRITVLRRLTVEEGTFRNPFIVATTADVDDMRDDPHAWYAMSGDIDMTAFGLFTPIGTDAAPWRGGLDGRGYKIQNLDLDHSAVPLTEAVGLFGHVDGALIRRLGIEDADVNAGVSTEYKASLVGIASGDSVIEDCYADSVTAGGVETSADRAGGLVGLVNAATIRRCWAAVPITGAVGIRVGGLVAFDLTDGLTAFQNKQDTDVGITDLGNGVTTAQVQALTTAQMQTRAQYGEASTDPQVTTLLLPDRASTFFDFFTIWLPPIAATDYARHRQFY